MLIMECPHLSAAVKVSKPTQTDSRSTGSAQSKSRSTQNKNQLICQDKGSDSLKLFVYPDMKLTTNW